MTEIVECPYCNADVQFEQADGVGCEEDVSYEKECDICDKSFIFYTSIRFRHQGHKVECLNGSPHNWTMPYRPYNSERHPNFWRRECQSCNKIGQENNPKWALKL